MAEAERPFPPGSYPIVVVGSGPGGLQLSYALRKLGVEHAVISADAGPGGMFLRWPFFQRLLSWTKPYAPAEAASRAYQRYDWNSLLAEEPGLNAIAAEFLDGSSYFPSRPAMQANLEAFAERAAIRVRYGTRWESTRREDGPDGTRFVLGTTDMLPAAEETGEPLVITADTTLDPGKTYGRIVIQASNITIDGRDAWLIGATDGDPKDYRGTAISAEGVSNVTLRNVHAKGWETGLHVVDGSTLPTQGSANPALTIMALAARAADLLAAGARAGLAHQVAT